MKRILVLALRIVVPLAILAILAHQFGSDAFRPALEVLAPVPIMAAVALGFVAMAAQAARWRLLMASAGLAITQREATVEYYRACALNAVLPGGVAGDVLRAWRQRTGAAQGWRPVAMAVIADRAIGLCVLMSMAAVVLVADEPGVAAILTGVAVVSFLIARPSLRRLSRVHRAAVAGWSVIALAAFLGMAMVAADAIGVSAGPRIILTLGLANLAGMAIPLNLGGWGPREAAGAIAATLVGAPAEVGLAVAAGYGLLSTISVLPGFLALGHLPQARTRGRRTKQVELDAHVITENEPA
jgi:uncharacterized membrane protein YbhN (UPF0104 family)